MSLPKCIGNYILRCRGYSRIYRRDTRIPCQEYATDYHYCSLGAVGGYQKKIFEDAGGWYIQKNIPQIIKLCNPISE